LGKSGWNPAFVQVEFYSFKEIALWQDFFRYSSMSAKKKVLIIDDEVDACLLLKNYFAKKEFEVYCSYTLKEGLQQVKNVHPDILFLDNNLPDGFGWEASGSLLRENPELEIHLISAYHNSMLNHGRRQIKVWQKPISFKTLDERL
jgi:two-component system, OmpR family, response regulator